MRCSASSMPSPSRSNFTSPMAAQSSLSHCSTRAARHARPLDRAHLDDGPVAQHHAGRVDAEVARPVQHLGRQLGHQRRHPAGLRLVHRRRRRQPRPCPASIPADQASTCSGVNPNALPTSRTAERGR